jgi:hypothetical protein
MYKIAIKVLCSLLFSVNSGILGIPEPEISGIRILNYQTKKNQVTRTQIQLLAPALY